MHKAYREILHCYMQYNIPILFSEDEFSVSSFFVSSSSSGVSEVFPGSSSVTKNKNILYFIEAVHVYSVEENDSLLS